MREERDAFFSDLFIRYSPNVYKYAFRKTRMEEDSEDLSQDTFLALWSCVDLVMEHENPLGWLMQAIHYRTLCYFADGRRRSVEVPLELCGDMTREEPGFADLENPLLDALNPMEQRIARLLIIGYRREEIAKLLGMSYGACAMRVIRLQRKLLEEQGKLAEL